MNNRALKKRVEQLERKQPSKSTEIERVYLVAPGGESEPVLHWTHPDILAKEQKQNDKSCNTST